MTCPKLVNKEIRSWRIAAVSFMSVNRPPDPTNKRICEINRWKGVCF